MRFCPPEATGTGDLKPVDGMQRRSTDGPESARKEFATVTQPLRVDAVTDPLGQMPFDRHFQHREALRGLEQGLRRDEVVAVAVDQQNRRPGNDLLSHRIDPA